MDSTLDRTPWHELPQAQVDALDGDAGLAYEVGALADKFVRGMPVPGVVLDYTPASIKTLEELLTVAYRQIPRGWLAKLTGKAFSEDKIFVVAQPFGAYLGETIRRNLGGRWTYSDPMGEGSSAATLDMGDSCCVFPMNKVFKRLADGPADDVWSYWSMLHQLMQQKSAATGPPAK